MEKRFFHYTARDTYYAILAFTEYRMFQRKLVVCHWVRGIATNVCTCFSVLCCHVQADSVQWLDTPCKKSY